MKPEHQILHNKFQQYGANAREWMRKCILLLPEIEKNRIWEQKKFGSIYEYAAKLAGMSHNTVDDALRILKRIEDKPELIKIVEEKGLNAVRPIVTIATSATESFWAEKAKNMSKRTLETYVQEFRKTFFGEGVPTTDPGNLSVSVTAGLNLTKSGNPAETFFRTGTGNDGINSQQQAISIFDLAGGVRSEFSLDTFPDGEKEAVPMLSPAGEAFGRPGTLENDKKTAAASHPQKNHRHGS